MALGREGGHGHDRIAHALGDATGKELVRAVATRLLGQSHINVWERTFTIDLLTLAGYLSGPYFPVMILVQTSYLTD